VKKTTTAVVLAGTLLAVTACSAPATESAAARCPAAEQLAAALHTRFSVTTAVTDGAEGGVEQGRSVAALVPADGATPGGVGDQIARRGRADDRSEYVMWNRTYWPAGSKRGTTIEDRGNATLNAVDHVRIVIDRTKCMETR
jgi:hypothetical protein